MPLTNPNKVVTEERLSEFYGQILPYMGGMPDVLANKFSKGDLYSTDEKMIGCWTDGKPLYQQVVFNTSGSAGPWKLVVDLPTTCVIVKCECYLALSGNLSISKGYYNGAAFDIIFNSNTSNQAENGKLIAYVSDASFAGKPLTSIVQYTKTTDSPIAIGSDTDYSTDEKIVGTWIDGRPVWQNTVSTGGNVPSGATLILRTAMASTGYDTILYTK